MVAYEAREPFSQRSAVASTPMRPLRVRARGLLAGSRPPRARTAARQVLSAAPVAVLQATISSFARTQVAADGQRALAHLRRGRSP
jgi:hypothetical protein